MGDRGAEGAAIPSHHVFASLCVYRKNRRYRDGSCPFATAVLVRPLAHSDWIHVAQSKASLVCAGRLMRKMRFYGSLMLDYFKNYMKTRLTYRADFWIEVLSDLLFQAMNLFFVLIVFRHTPLLGGWTEQQILFIYGFFMVPYGVFVCFFNLWNFSERYIVKGEMDRVLTRPAYNLAQLVLENMDPSSLIGAIAGFIIMAATWPYLEVSIHWYDPLMFVLLCLGAILLYGGIYVLLISLSFFIDAPTGILPLIWNIQNYGRYPITVYNRIIKVLLTWILPFAFVGFYPAAYFLDRENWGGMALLTPLVGLFFFWIGILCWNLGVRKYRGAGS